ncbi:sulfite exporter TauE/SafE family protein [Mycobacterium sp. M1]|uniref:Probable membrane transporter protein n=1 Tax=Mycolicibacter acidiphilus TaxID=2835306 RepID=A0ABS5RFJ3_9MYCO|nr:sulfite exporter TauE/SafE family protein [Mycolicibacter acidiphilus]MBS9533056.1 sulfite exporter TauE/SafE family protein [Mycolicibacter acidiphilus]
MTTVAVLLVVGCLIGVTTVLFGFGGGFVTVPAVYAAVQATGGPDAMHTAVATSTAVMIVNASVATLSSVRHGGLRTEYLWPLVVFIGAGAVLGAAAADRAPELLLHVLFIAYLAGVIADGALRRGFVGGAEASRPLSPVESSVGGAGIGAVASFLGVGGSVLTVPLLRRRGVSMTQAAALANPLSIPVAVAGTAVYALATTTGSEPGQVGHVNLLAASALLGGSLPTIALTRRVASGRIPDRVHAIAYLVLLGVVLIAMIVALVI